MRRKNERTTPGLWKIYSDAAGEAWAALDADIDAVEEGRPGELRPMDRLRYLERAVEWSVAAEERRTAEEAAGGAVEGLREQILELSAKLETERQARVEAEAREGALRAQVAALTTMVEQGAGEAAGAGDESYLRRIVAQGWEVLRALDGEFDA